MELSSQVPSRESATAAIALCCNGTMLPGLHATLASLVEHLGRRDIVSLTLFVQDITEREQESIRATVTEAGGVASLIFRSADVSDFKGLRALQGDWMTYLRLYLAKLMPEADTILYLDSDLIVHTDACAIFAHRRDDSPLGAVKGETVAWSLDREFLKSVGLTDEDQCFNAGVLLINAALWRRTGLVERALEFGNTHSSQLKSADQAILVALFSRDFFGLPEQLNMGVDPAARPLAMTEGIYHFIGSPKPWDPLGRLVHGNWRMWSSVIRQTRFSWTDFLLRHFRAYGARAWTLRRSYIRTWLRKK
jgi:lipopolysaccharide biosynthesis glycosyltransferase